MNIQACRDNDGRRALIDRRCGVKLDFAFEKRNGKDRRTGIDRRKVRDPIIRIVGNERRKTLRNLL